MKMKTTTKQSNQHVVHPARCVVCERKLPKRAHHDRCAGCRAPDQAQRAMHRAAYQQQVQHLSGRP
jgi:hypothetical protein